MKPGLFVSTGTGPRPRHAAGSVLAASTNSRSQCWPLLMKILLPLMTSIPIHFGRGADFQVPPAPGSVMPIAATVSPLTMRGSQYLRAAPGARLPQVGRMMSLCTCSRPQNRQPARAPPPRRTRSARWRPRRTARHVGAQVAVLAHLAEQLAAGRGPPFLVALVRLDLGVTKALQRW